MKKINKKIFNLKQNNKNKIFSNIIIIILIGFLLFFWFKNNKSLFLENLNNAINGIGFFEKYNDFKPVISIGEKWNSFFQAGTFIAIGQLILSIIINKITFAIIMFYISFKILKHFVIYRDVYFKDERSKKKHEKSMFLPKKILQTLYFFYDIIFIIPITKLIIYFQKKNESGQRIFIEHIILIVTVYLLLTGQIFNIMIDIVAFLKSYLLLFKLETSGFEIFLKNIFLFSKRYFYFFIDNMNLFRSIVLGIFTYNVVAVLDAKRKKQRLLKRFIEYVDEKTGVITAIIGFVGGGKTLTLVAMARAQELLNRVLFRKEINRIEIQYPDIKWIEVKDQFELNYSKDHIKSSSKAIKNIMNSIESIEGVDVWKRTYNDFKPNPKIFKDDIRLYATAQFKLLQPTLIHSNISIQANGPTPELIKHIQKYGQRSGDAFVDLDQPIYANIFNFDNLRIPHRAVSKLVVRSISQGDIVVLTEADKDFSTFNMKSVLKSGFDKVLSVIRHRLSFSYFPAGKLFMDYQTDTSLIRQGRSKGNRVFRINSSKNRTPLLMRPLLWFANKRYDKADDNKVKLIEKREDNNIYVERNNKIMSRWNIIKNWLNQFAYHRLNFNIQTPDGEFIEKLDLGISEDNHSFYESVAFAVNEREAEEENTHTPRRFKSLKMTKEEMKSMYSEHYDEQYLSSDPDVKSRRYDYSEDNDDDSDTTDDENEKKYEYYILRVDDESLSKGQRSHAKKWIEKYEGGDL